MKIFVLIFFLFFISNVGSMFTKYKSYEFSGIDYVVFESKEFKDDEEMHFKIKTYKNSLSVVNNYVRYYYVTDPDGDLNEHGNDYVYYKKTDYEDNYEIKYFTIKKRKIDYIGYSGDYLVLWFQFDSSTYWGIVTNTEKDEGKFPAWAIAIIVVVLVAIIAVSIICCICRRIRRAKAMHANQVAATAYTANQIAAQQNAIAQQNAYIAQQNAIAQQNYQAQMYQDPNYMTPNVQPGYSSNAPIA